MKRALLLVVVAVAVAAAIFIWYQRASPSAPSGLEHRNVILITVDTLRADRVGRDLTPHIDRLAARGRSFSNIRATVPLTLPSHVSLMTGTIPPVHGVRENGVVFDRKTPTLARVFKDAGYRTAAFVGAYVLNRRFGLDEGFDTYDDTVRRDPARSEQLEAERRGGDVVDAAIQWLNSQAPRKDSAPIQPSTFNGQHFFLWVHLYDPHAPYAPPPPFRRPGGNGYDGEVLYADAQVGRLLETLESHGLVDRTVVAITGDHGESLGEHGEQTHGMLLYDAALRVPLVIASPGPRSDHPAPCHYGLASELLKLAGLRDRVPTSMAAASSPSAGSTAMSFECAAYAETRYPRRAGWHALSALSDGRWKLIASSERELYDVTSDSAEQRNVATEQPNVVNAMAATLAKLKSVDRVTTAMPADAAERLRALGYASGSPASTADEPNAPNPSRVIGAWTEFEEALGHLERQRPADAVQILEKLKSRQPNSAVFHTTYALALRESGEARAALAAYKAAASRWPNEPSLFHDLAAAARDAGDAAEAMRAERAALTLDANNAMAHNGLGLLHADAGRDRDAITAFTRATELDPTNASYWANLGNSRRAVADPGGAEAAYQKSLALDSEFADALNGLGALYVQGGRAREAIALFERALTRDPKLYEARLNLGIAYQESGQREKAAEIYREVLKNTPPRYARERNAAAELLKSLK